MQAKKDLPGLKKMNFEIQRMVWVLDRLARDPKLITQTIILDDNSVKEVKQTDFRQLMHRFNFHEGQSHEESKKIKESLKDRTNVQVRRVLVTPTLIKVTTLSKEPSNRVIREYRGYVNFFCQVTLVCEN